MGQGIWELAEQAGDLESAANGWDDVASALTGSGDTFNAKAAAVMAAGWEGRTAESFDDHRRQLVASLDTAGDVATAIAEVLRDGAGVVRIAQAHLDNSWATVSGIRHIGFGTWVQFFPEDEAEEERIRRTEAEAQDIRADLDAQLARGSASLKALSSQWDDVASTWESVADGSADGFDVPEESGEPGIIHNGDQTVVNTGDGDDTVTVWTNPDTGVTFVIINGVPYRVPPGQEVVVRTGDGNDTITVQSGDDVRVTVAGGEGDDVVRDHSDGDNTHVGGDGRDSIDAGGGDNYVSGGADRDYLDGQGGDDDVYGGHGDDTAYGLDGDDTVSGGEGKDYLEGAEGDDSVLGGDGDDTVSGGRGDDTLVGGAGNDVHYAGRGDDTTYGGSGSDTSYGEDGDTDADDVETQTTVTIQLDDLSDFIKIEGSPEFVARVQADLDLLAASPTGQQMLAALQDEHENSGFLGINRDTVTIRELTEDNNYAHGDGTIEYNPHRQGGGEGRPPIAGLYHEMAHIYDFFSENFDDTDYNGDDEVDHGVNQGERTAVGLTVDHDHDPSTPEIIDPDHPVELTENGLRDEIGWEDRESYN